MHNDPWHAVCGKVFTPCVVLECAGVLSVWVECVVLCCNVVPCNVILPSRVLVIKAHKYKSIDILALICIQTHIN